MLSESPPTLYSADCSKLDCPSESEWTQIERLIDNPAILNHLTSLPTSDLALKQVDADSQAEKNDISFVEVREKYIDVYRGKVIYIDFYSTWCGPCRLEIPDAKRLKAEFADKEVVFLNLCAKSEHDAWESLLKQKEIGGENFLLSDSEYRQFAKHFGVRGFSTYVLIDRDGSIVSKDAPWPSSLHEISKALNDILVK